MSARKPTPNESTAGDDLSGEDLSGEDLLASYPLADFEPHVHQTWLFGFWGTEGLFDPMPSLGDRYGNDFDPDRFDFQAYEQAVANACLEVSRRRLETAFREAAPEVRLERVDGKRRDGLYVQVEVTRPFCRFLRRHVCRDAGFERQGQHLRDFASWLGGRYRSYPGFHPWHSTGPEDWIEETAGFTDFRPCRQGHKLGALLKFVTTHYERHYGEEWSEIDIYYAANETGPISPEIYYEESG